MDSTGDDTKAAQPDKHERISAWLRPTGPESRLGVSASIVVVIALQVSLSGKYGLHPWWLLTALEVALLVVLTAINSVRMTRETRFGRHFSMALARAVNTLN